ncbi:hypothetical protein ACFVVM_32885 [Nocardia sp. NPDC058176]|uniref:hypothetical protein n=1 Tax=Nocardia sp. NPDC058176 TaxID=3346368 RepID=UPI0036DBD43E
MPGFGRLTRAAVLAAAIAISATACGGGTDTNSSSSDPADPDLTAVPAGLRWELFQGVKLPAGKDGPRTTEAAALGFSRTPQGAALAAINHSTRVTIAPDSKWGAIAGASLVPGPGKDWFVSNRALVSITASADAEKPRIQGYSITSYSPAEADVLIFSAYSDGSVGQNAVHVTWMAEDWRLRLPDPADKTPTVTSIAAIPADAVQLGSA